MKHLCLNCEKGDMVRGEKIARLHIAVIVPLCKAWRDGIVLSAEKLGLLAKKARAMQKLSKSCV